LIFTSSPWHAHRPETGCTAAGFVGCSTADGMPLGAELRSTRAVGWVIAAEKSVNMPSPTDHADD
jgi:hypothetical protein